MNKKTKTIVWIIVGVAVALLLVVLLSDIISGAEELSIPEFLAKLAKGEINQLYVDAYNWTGKFVDAEGRITAVYTVTMPSIYDFGSFQAVEEYIKTNGVPNFSLMNLSHFEMSDPNAGSVWSSLVPLLGVALVAVMFWLIMRSASGGGNSAMSMCIITNGRIIMSVRWDST